MAKLLRCIGRSKGILCQQTVKIASTQFRRCSSKAPDDSKSLFDRGQVLNSRTYFCTDSTDIEEISIDKRIIKFLDEWDIEKAISSAISGIQSRNSSLSGHAITHLLEQLGEIGDVENLLVLMPYLQNFHLISSESIYYHFSKALYNSGQMEQGVPFLKNVCLGHYDHEDANVLFTYLVVPTILHFPESQQLYMNVVNELVEIGDYYLVAVLWKCYVLCGDFTNAGKILEEYYSEIKSFFPVMVNEICQMKDRVTTTMSHEEMLRYLIDIIQLRKKKQKILVFRTLLQILYSESRWFDLQMMLMTVKDSEVELPKDVILHHVRAIKSCANHEELGIDQPLLRELELWANEPENSDT